MWLLTDEPLPQEVPVPESELTVWSATGEDRRAWLRTLASWERHEVYAHPEFLTLFARPDDAPVCLRYRDDSGEALYPLIMRDLARLPHGGKRFEGWYDAVTAPYGYGGPFVRTDGDVRDVVRRFYAAYASWARETRLVSEYTTFAPHAATPETYPGDVATKMPVVVKHLTAADIDATIKDAQRRSIRRARKVGVTVELDADGDDAEALVRVCAETSARHGGFAAGHEVTPELVDAILTRLRDYAVLFHARVDGIIVSSELVFLSGETVVFFRGGTASSAMNSRANQLLKYEICVWAKRAGYRWYLLGGGTGPHEDDPLFVYKKTFATDGVRSLHVGKWIIDAERYHELVASRERHEHALGSSFTPADGYFPTYRAPMAVTRGGV